MVMESIIPPCNTGKIPSATQDSVESLTDFLKKKIKDCGKKTRKGREEERVYGGTPVAFPVLTAGLFAGEGGKRRGTARSTVGGGSLFSGTDRGWRAGTGIAQ